MTPNDADLRLFRRNNRRSASSRVRALPQDLRTKSTDESLAWRSLGARYRISGQEFRNSLRCRIPDPASAAAGGSLFGVPSAPRRVTDLRPDLRRRADRRTYSEQLTNIDMLVVRVGQRSEMSVQRTLAGALGVFALVPGGVIAIGPPVAAACCYARMTTSYQAEGRFSTNDLYRCRIRRHHCQSYGGTGRGGTGRGGTGTGGRSTPGTGTPGTGTPGTGTPGTGTPGTGTGGRGTPGTGTPGSGTPGTCRGGTCTGGTGTGGTGTGGTGTGGTGTGGTGTGGTGNG